MKQRRIEELSRIREEGKQAALEGCNHTDNPYRYANGTYWYMGWEQGMDMQNKDIGLSKECMTPSFGD